MEKLKLPELKPLIKADPNKKKILLLSDDLRMYSGIAVMSREFVLGTLDKYNWVQVAGAIRHPEAGKIVDMSEDARKLSGVKDASVTLYPTNGYGDPDLIRNIINRESPDAILHFTDPRYWAWLYNIEHELRQILPITYYNIWDDAPAPMWNLPFYESCDLVMNISKQTHALVEGVMGDKCFNLEAVPEDTEIANEGKTFIAYVPHGINHDLFKPVADAKAIREMKNKYWGGTKAEFILMASNRNIRRKNLADVILAYKTFCDKLEPGDAAKCLLAMNTNAIDDNGTDLIAVKEAICPDYDVVFTKEVPVQDVNLMYNAASAVINIASNEGFGLTTAEALMAGTPIIANVTGGLQDQMRFEDEDGNWITQTPDFPTNHGGRYRTHGKWVIPVFPTARSLKGSPPTPYIFDDTCDWEDVASAIWEMWIKTDEQRAEMGRLGREWMLSDESAMSAEAMSENFKINFDFLFEVWKPRDRFRLFNTKEAMPNKVAPGILKSDIRRRRG